MKVTFNFTERDVRKILFSLLLIEISLATIYLVNIGIGQPFEAITGWFDLNGEATIPSWFSSLQILCIALVFLIISQHIKRHQLAFRRFIILLSLIFIFLSMDEAASIHEQITNVLRDITWIPHFFEGGHEIWITLYLIAGLLLAIGGFRQALELWRQCKRGALFMIFGLIVFFAGGVGLEMIYYSFLVDNTNSLLFNVEVVFEEFFEMAGMSLIFYGSMLFALQNQKETGQF